MYCRTNSLHSLDDLYLTEDYVLCLFQREVIRTKSTAMLPFGLCTVGLIVSTLWMIYGMVTKDPFLEVSIRVVGNGIGDKQKLKRNGFVLNKSVSFAGNVLERWHFKHDHEVFYYM